MAYVERLFRYENAAILQLLMTAKEVSMYSDLDEKLKKVLVMSAASYFENEAKDAIHALSRASAIIISPYRRS